jgi:tetratricopeptide (TPR) repeat protein
MSQDPTRPPGGGLVLAVLAAGLVTAWLAMAAPAGAQPTEADIFVAEALLAIEERDYATGLARARQALAVEPEHAEALYYAGVALLALQQPAEAVTFLERARQKAPGDPPVAYQLALAYIALGQHDRATPLMETVYARQPDLDSAGYYTGYLRYRKQDYRGALQAFRTGQTTDPNVAQLTRYYTGLSLASLGLTEQALAEVEDALRQQPVSPITTTAERLRDSLSAQRGRGERLRIELRAGVFYDSNVPVQPHSSDDVLAQALRTGDRNSFGELLGARVEYDWFRSGPWESTVGYSFFTTYNNDLPDFNVIDNVVTLGLRHRGSLLDMPFQWGVLYGYEFLLLDEEELLQRHSLTLHGTLVESDRNLTVGLLRVERKDFQESGLVVAAEEQSGFNTMAGLVHYFRFAQDRHHLKLGYQFDVDSTDGDNYDYHGHRLLAGALYTLPWGGVRLSYDFSVHLRDYRSAHTLLPAAAPGTVERRDREVNHLLRVEVPLPYNLTLAADYLRIDADSNLASFDYSRDVVSVSLSWQY